MNRTRIVSILKRTIKYSAIGLVTLIGFALIANAIWIQVSGRQVANRMAKVRAAGEPTTWEEMVARSNAIDGSEGFYTPALRNEVEVMDRKLHPVMKSPNWRNGEFNDVEMRSMEEIFADHPAVLAVTKDDSYTRWYSVAEVPFPVDGHITDALLKAQSAPRVLVRILSVRMAYLRRKGETRKSFQVCLDALRLARLDGNSGNLVGGLVQFGLYHIAIDMMNRTLRSQELGQSQYDLLAIELAKHNPMDVYRETLRGERVSSMTILRNEIPWSKYWFTRGLFNYTVVKCLDVQEAQAQTSDDAESLARPVDLMQTAQGSSLAVLLIPAVEAYRNATLRTECQMRSLQILNSIYANDKKDADAVDITQLGLHIDATTDPFTGKPLIVKKTAEGWTIYSVGPNGVDDGGNVDASGGKPLDFGIAPPKARL